MAESNDSLPWSPAGDRSQVRIDTSIPHPARVYDYWLGGKDNFEADRQVAEAVMAATPGVVFGARSNRAFLGKVVRMLAREGIDQFLDIGTGIPTQGNTHEVAQAINPAARIAYVDNDPIVMVHARALLKSTPQGKTTYVEADLREPKSILTHPDVLATLDFSRPVAVVIIGTLIHVRDEDDPWDKVKQFTDATCPGSYLAISHLTADFAPENMKALAESYNTGPLLMTNRTGPQIARFFEGFSFVLPGLVSGFYWDRNEPVPPDVVHGGYFAVGRKL